MKTIIGINGACGRMGQRIAQLAREDSSLEIGVALEAAGHPALGKDLGDLIGTGKLGVPLVPVIPLEKKIEANAIAELGVSAKRPTIAARFRSLGQVSCAALQTPGRDTRVIRAGLCMPRARSD